MDGRTGADGQDVGACVRGSSGGGATGQAVALKGHEALQRLARTAARPGAALATIHALGHACTEYALANPQLYRLMMGTGITKRDAYSERAAVTLIDGHIDAADAVAEAERSMRILDRGLVHEVAKRRVDVQLVDLERVYPGD